MEGQGLSRKSTVHYPGERGSVLAGQAVLERNAVTLREGLRLVGVLTYDHSQEKYGLIVTEGRQADGMLGETGGALDDAERRILKMVADGLSCKHIARSLGTNIFEAGRRVRRTVKKLGANSRAEAVAQASLEGLLDPATGCLYSQPSYPVGLGLRGGKHAH